MELKHGELSNNIQKNRTDPDKRKKEFDLFKNAVETVKKTARIIGFAVGATMLVASCGGHKTFKGDTEDAVDVADGQDAEDSLDEPDIPDIADVIDEDISEDIIEDAESEDVMEDEAEIVCIEGSSIGGTVPTIIANAEDETLEFIGLGDELLHGDAETTIGADVSTTDLLMLGECPHENSIAAFGARDTSINVVPFWRIDITNTGMVFPEFGAETCIPPDEPYPVSMFNDSTNLSVMPALLGTYEGSATAGFADILAVAILDGITEVTSPIVLAGSDHEVKSIAVVSTSSSLGIDSAVYSNTGTELYSSILETLFGEKRSKTLKMSQLDSDDSMLPDIGRWRAEGIPGPDASTYVCLRPCDPDPASTPVEKTIEIIGLDITGVIDDSCGKLFASFDIVSVDADFDPTRSPPYGIEPVHLAGDYSLLTGLHYGDGLDAMSDLSPKVYLFVRRESTTILDSGELVIMDILLTIQLETRDANPATDAVDTDERSFNIRLSVPTSGDYRTVCGCDASLP